MTYDPSTRTAIEKAVEVEQPVVAPVTQSALSWLGAGYLIALTLITFAAEALVALDPAGLPDWFVRAGGVAALGAILRILERVVRWQLQIRGEG